MQELNSTSLEVGVACTLALLQVAQLSQITHNGELSKLEFYRKIDGLSLLDRPHRGWSLIKDPRGEMCEQYVISKFPSSHIKVADAVNQQQQPT